MNEPRQLVVEGGLVPAAFALLTEAMLDLPFEALGPTKTLLKRYFSTAPWGPADDEALAATVGTGQGRWSRPLDAELTLEYGWEDGRFAVRVVSTADDPPADDPPAGDDPLAATFGGPVVPEATPNPRSIRFRLEHDGDEGGAGRWYESAAAATAAGDTAAMRLFDTFPEVANVLVGAGFVNVSLRRAADWERLLAPVLAAVTEAFAGGRAARDLPLPAPERAHRRPASARSRTGRLEEAWRELGSLRPADPADLATLEGAARDDDPFRRQAAANLLGEADPARAATLWTELVRDRARSVRRATVDAIVDAGRDELRPLLEEALGDADAWIRWKALRGLVELGVGDSEAAIASLAEDPDFRVRLEVAAALRSPRPGSGPGAR